MHVLITWGSKMGGTAGIASMLGESLEQQGVKVDVRLPGSVRTLADFDAVIVGGALYANRWHRDARRFVNRHEEELRHVPVWFFSSGPLDDSADRKEIPPPGQVTVLMERVGAQGHMTFGGRLEADARGFPASAMARKNSGDWRNPERIRAWAAELARALPTARPGMALEQPDRSLVRLLGYGVAGWAACAVVMLGLLQIVGVGAAIVLHALAAPAIFGVIAGLYFRGHGARDPLPTALAFAGIVAFFDLVVIAGLVQRSAALAGSIGGFWLPLALIFLVTWAVGGIMSTMPWPKPEPQQPKPTPPKPTAATPRHAS